MKIFVCLAALVAFAAQAQEKPAAPAHGMPQPPSELKAEKWFVGTWTCKGKMHAGPMGPEGPISSKLTFNLDLAGFWLHYRGTATSGPMKGKETLIGLASWIGDHHERYDFHPGGLWHLTSKGWDGDKLTFEGDAMGPHKSTVRHTMTKKGSDQFESVIVLDGKPHAEETCTKTAKE